MGHTYTKILTHVVFGTKGRVPSLRMQIRPRLHAYIGGILRELQCDCLAINGASDHVHILLSTPAKRSVSDVVRVIKANSSRWIREQSAGKTFSWQSGYSAFSVSQSSCEIVKKYIERQEEHHRKMSFKDELRGLLNKHGIVFDERHMWN